MSEQDRSDQGKFMQRYDEPLAKSPRCTRFPQSIDDILNEMDGVSDFIRSAVIKQIKEKRLSDSKDEQVE